MEALLPSVRLSEDKGQSLVEFALSLMILLALTFGLMDFGRLVFIASQVQAAAEEGARAGIILNTTDTQIGNAARARLVAMNPAEVAVGITRPGGNTVEVSVSYDYHFMVPLIALFDDDGQVALQGHARMISH